jgi:hypothetical protein
MVNGVAGQFVVTGVHLSTIHRLASPDYRKVQIHLCFLPFKTVYKNPGILKNHEEDIEPAL